MIQKAYFLKLSVLKYTNGSDSVLSPTYTKLLHKRVYSSSTYRVLYPNLTAFCSQGCTVSRWVVSDLRLDFFSRCPPQLNFRSCTVHSVHCIEGRFERSTKTLYSTLSAITYSLFHAEVCPHACTRVVGGCVVRCALPIYRPRD